MIKYSFILLGLYFLYYAGNIAYDLFLKKQKTLDTDITEEFSLSDLAESQNSTTHVQIEDVENVKTPHSFLKKEFQTKIHGVEAEKPDLEDLRSRFEAEQDMDDEKGEAPVVRVPEQKVEKLPGIRSESKEAISDRMNRLQEESILRTTSKKDDERSCNESGKKEATLEQKEESVHKKNDWKEMLKLSETTVQMVANYEGQKVYSIL